MGKAIMKKEEFDHIIRHLVEMKEKDDLFGYIVQNYDGTPKCYDKYYSEAVFKMFVDDMTKNYPDANIKYNEGARGELIPKTTTINGTKHTYPPKMASVASSSRFCYLALRNGIDITIGDEHISGSAEFEKKCEIKFKKPIESDNQYSTPPHLDAYIKDSNCYFEVKCHEIFDSHKVVLKQKYWDLVYDEGNLFGLKPLEKSDRNRDTFEIPLKEFGIEDKTSTMFDIKQLICHLLGIANQDGDNKKLVYLFFKPDADKAASKSRSVLEDDVLSAYNRHLKTIFDNLSDEIDAIFNSKPITTFCVNNNIKLMAIAENSIVMEPLSQNNTYHLLK
ncbi:MAG: hypothetical protein IJL67_11465 [Oscillospiraceae bacterium]|nr:hypothetical protein [Oscillospiraceae bacterium]